MMAKSWRDYASSPRDISDISDVSPAATATVANVTNVAGLPPLVRIGLAKLREMAVPTGCNPEGWPRLVADALRLASEGRAQQALALGWSDLDLYGAATSDDEQDGLAAWLRGRRLLAITKDFASAEIAGGRAYFNRSTRNAGQLLWDLGR